MPLPTRQLQPGSAASGRRSPDQGLTVIELTVVMLMTGIVGAITITVILLSVRSMKVIDDTSVAADEARVAVERLSRDIRPGRVVMVQPGQVSFQSDQDGDGVISDRERITYTLVAAAPTGVELHRRTDPATAGAEVVARHLTASSRFSYDATARVVTVTVESDVKPGDGAAPVTVVTAVQLRNLA